MDDERADVRSLSGLPLPPLARPEDLEGFDPQERLGRPGSYPFTRGVYPTMYRGRPWTMRQFAGFGSAAETNARYRFLLERGQGGLSVAFDMPTLMGRDSDDPRSEGEVGRCGVATDSIADFEELFAGIPLGDISTSMTISGPPSSRSPSSCRPPNVRGSPGSVSTARCRRTSSRNTSPRRSGCSRPVPISGSSAT